MQSPVFQDNDVESMERATIAAVAPQQVEELPGWLLPMDSGSIGRARSAVPLSHVPAEPGIVRRIEQRYQAAGLPARFRLPEVEAFDALKQGLRSLDYQPAQPTWVQIAATASVLELVSDSQAQLDERPDAAWAALFLGEGFDPVDGASRVQNLSRASGTRFASIRQQGRTLAAGAGAFSHGWCSVHGMRTERESRGRGLAAQILVGIARLASQRGIDRIFLQVAEDNEAALALYRRARFVTVWRYEYWSKL